MRSPLNRALATAGLALALAAPAAAHHSDLSRAAAAGGKRVTLRGCLMTTAMVPRPASILQPVFRRPLDLSQTFYGPDPLLGIWGLRCDHAAVAGRHTGRLVVGIVGVPVGLTASGAAPLANNFDHALLRVDTDSRLLAGELRRAGIRARLAPAARYAHNRPGGSVSRGRLVIPGGYAVAVSATALDPTNPHDHVNRFDRLGLVADDAVDRFCFLPSKSCSASVSAPRGSSLRRVLGGPSAPVLAGFDHEPLRRIELGLGSAPGG